MLIGTSVNNFVLEYARLTAGVVSGDIALGGVGCSCRATVEGDGAMFIIESIGGWFTGRPMATGIGGRGGSTSSSSSLAVSESSVSESYAQSR